ncbi:hypothetical protein [Amycolatopsis sp. NPDC051128]|uniref:hypothetical protein n=1 Tax=Amycolatopsis sp. NPDC051128 TaxID=3155412 RepID=UPI00342B5BC0
MGRTLSRVAGVVFAGALATFAAAPAALAQDETSTSPTGTSTSTSEPTTTTAPTTVTTTEPTAPSTPVTTPGTTAASTTEALKTAAPETTTTTPTSAASEPLKDAYQDNAGAGFIGLGGEGVLVIACASGAPGDVATQYLSVTGGPDQDEADGRYWNYSVRVVDAPAGTTTAKFSWTCGEREGNGVVEFEQEEPPSTTTSSAAPSSTAPITTAPITTATPAAAGNSAPKAQVKVAPKGGVETGFGGTAW